MRSHTKFGLDRFSRFDVYCIQTDKQNKKHPDKQSMNIDRKRRNLCLSVCFICLIITCVPLARFSSVSFQAKLSSQTLYVSFPYSSYFSLDVYRYSDSLVPYFYQCPFLYSNTEDCRRLSVLDFVSLKVHDCLRFYILKFVKY